MIGTWLHCSIKDGSIIGLSPDDKVHTDVGPDENGNLPLSDTMLSAFFHVHVDEPLEDLLDLTRSVEDDEDADGNREIIHKFRGFVDIDGTFPDRANSGDVRDRDKKVMPVRGTKSRSDIMERQKTGRPVESTKPQSR